MKLYRLYLDANLEEEDIDRMQSYIDGEDEFYGSEAFGKLYEYFCNSGEMPYNVQKCRDETPDSWILNKLELEYE